MKNILVAALALLWSTALACAQSGIAGVALVPLGYCQISAAQLASAVSLASCTRASFTASAGSSSTQLVVTAVTGTIKIGDTILTGTGIPAGTTFLSQIPGVGTVGGAGTYNVSNANTASAASSTSGGIPTGSGANQVANVAYIESDTAAVRYRDDGAPPTTAIGLTISANAPLLYVGPLPVIQFIAATGSPVLNIAFYHSP